MSSGTLDDVGPEIVGRTFENMKIDAEWSVREVRRFEWWGYRLRQVVWADPCVSSDGSDVTRLHVQTDVLEGVPPSATLGDQVSVLNKLASFSALVLDPDAGLQ